MRCAPGMSVTDGCRRLFDELFEQLHGEDLDRVLEAIAIRRRRPFCGVPASTDLWIRASEPDREQAE